MGKEYGVWLNRRLWGGGNTRPLKMSMWEAVPEHAVYIISIIKNRSHQAIFLSYSLEAKSRAVFSRFYCCYGNQ